MITEELQAIKERCDLATSGPWRVVPDARPDIFCPSDSNGGYLGAGHIATVSKYGPQWQDGKWCNHDDAEFIAHARTDIPALLDEIIRLREADEIREAAYVAETIARAKAEAELVQLREQLLVCLREQLSVPVVCAESSVNLAACCGTLTSGSDWQPIATAPKGIAVLGITRNGAGLWLRPAVYVHEGKLFSEWRLADRPNIALYYAPILWLPLPRPPPNH